MLRFELLRDRRILLITPVRVHGRMDRLCKLREARRPLRALHQVLYTDLVVRHLHCFLGYRLINAQALVFLFPFVVLAATDPASATSRLLGSRALHFLGVISYSIYMVHSFVLIIFI